MDESLIERIRRLLAPLGALELDLVDESRLHAGHDGARDGGSHFRLRLVSPAFQGLPRVQRHRLVYDCLSDLMPREVHALAMSLLSPDEAASAGTLSPARE